MEAILVFYFENLGEAEVFKETAKTYPAIANYASLAVQKLDKGNYATVDVAVLRENYEHVAGVLEALSSMHTKGPASGRYEWK